MIADKKKKIYCKDCVHFWEHSGECHINPLRATPKLDYSYCPAAERKKKKHSDFYPCADEDGMVDVSGYPFTK